MSFSANPYQCGKQTFTIRWKNKRENARALSLPSSRGRRVGILGIFGFRHLSGNKSEFILFG
jgi:hypothetical protein